MANPLSKAALKKKYDEYRKAVKAGKMTREEMETQGRIMAASYQANKGKTKPAPKAKAKPATKKTTKSEAASRFYSSSSGTRGQLRPSNPASPTVRRKGSTTGASVDPRERSLRKNREDAKRSRRRGLKMNRRGRRVR